MMRDPKKSPIRDGRFGVEQLVALSSDEKSLRRGRRAAPRTEVCRPCLFWTEDTPEEKNQGVLLDLSPYGMRLRTIEPRPTGTVLYVQMMRDEDFQVPLSAPIRAEVAYQGNHYEGFVDHGLRRLIGQVKKPQEFRPANARTSRTATPRRSPQPEKEPTGLARRPRRLERNRG